VKAFTVNDFRELAAVDKSHQAHSPGISTTALRACLNSCPKRHGGPKRTSLAGGLLDGGLDGIPLLRIRRRMVTRAGTNCYPGETCCESRCWECSVDLKGSCLWEPVAG
jgi:hypothetical protein